MNVLKEIFKAESPEEVPSQFGYDFFTGNTQPELDERRQLGELLIAAADSPLLQYPLEVAHTRNRTPDFRLTMGSTVVGVEATKVANHELEWGRGLQRELGLGTMNITQFLRGARQRDRRDILNEGFATPAVVLGNTIKEADEFWLKQAESIVRRKTQIFRRADFERQEENWLLLWDRLRSSEWDLERRIPMLSALLLEFWAKDWFSKVIVEQNHFKRFVVLSSEGVTWLSGRPAF